MLRRCRRVGSALLLVVAMLGAAGISAAEEIEWEPNVYPENQLFSSYIVATAMLNLPEEDKPSWGDRHLGDEDGVIGAQLEHVPKGAKITVKVFKSLGIEGGRITVIAPKGGQWLVHPKVVYDFDALIKVRQPRPLNIRFAVSVNGVPLGEKTQTVVLRSINDCLFSVDEGDDVTSDYGYLFAAYVNENHPWVDFILREALESGIVDSFDGYQSGDPAQVLRQMYAIWDVMQRRGMKYSSITETASESDTVFSQHIRLFDDAIRAKQANCVDGSVLLAAIYRKIGLHPMLVAVPGHMFLAVSLDPENEQVVGLETTMMGDKNQEAGEPSPTIPDALREEWSDRPSWNSFDGAVDYATAALKQDLHKFTSENDPDYQITDIAEARGHGILPIASADDPKDIEAIVEESAPKPETDDHPNATASE